MNDAAKNPGICQICRCTQNDACRLPDGDACSWFDQERTLCNAPACITAWTRRERELQAAKRQERRKAQAVGPWKVKKRDAQTGRATVIVRNKNYRPRGRAA